jgi:hypothetical protein
MKGMLLALLLLGSLLPLSASDTSLPPSTPDEANARMAGLLDQIVGEVAGEVGNWSFTYLGVEMLLVTDGAYDRMRILAPIAEGGQLDAAQLRLLLRANFGRALDAKYALFQDRVWSTYVHPLRSLSKEQLISALRQVASLYLTYGTSFSSMDISFGGGEESPGDVTPAPAGTPQDSPQR